MSEKTNIEFDSNEEREFFEWLLELYKVINDKYLYRGTGYDYPKIYYHHTSYLLTDEVRAERYKALKTKVNRVQKTILQPLRYTPDFLFFLPLPYAVYFRDKLDLLPRNLFVYAKEGYFSYIVDVKGAWGGRFRDDKYFSAIRKIVFELKDDFINKVVPVKLFKKTFCPEILRYMKNRKVLTERKNCVGLPTAQEFAAKVAKYYKKFMELTDDESANTL